MYIFGELPSDLTDIQESLGPPPAWFRPESGITTPEQASAAYYSYPQAYGFRGLGDREVEVEANPVEELQELKFKQEMNKKIPVEANRYTTVNPLSPLFRDKKAKFGYGGLPGLGEGSTMGGAILKLTWTGMGMACFYHGFKRNDGSLLWGFLWSFLGPIGLALALSQGFGKPI